MLENDSHDEQLMTEDEKNKAEMEERIRAVREKAAREARERAVHINQERENHKKLRAKLYFRKP